MRKLYPRIFLFFVFVLLSNVALPQQILTDAFKAKELVGLSASLNTSNAASRKKAYDMARKKGWITFKVKPDGTTISLQGVDASGFPIYLTTYSNVIAAATTRTNTVQPGGTLDLNLNGSSAALANKLAIWDAGLVYTSHQEFAGKTITNRDGATSISDHSNHVAGTMIAKGVYAPAKGMAFGATSLISYDYNNDNTEMAAAASALLVSNHSYGYIAGWYYNDTQARWEWYGLPGDTEDYKFGFYDTNTRTYDQIAYNAPKYLIVIAAGNNRGETGPAVGTTYYGYASRTDATIVNKGLRPATISSNDGYDIISLTGTAKNVLTVSAVNPLPNGPATAADVQVAYFSSFGPTDDGRVKPDICGDGVNVLSTGVGSTDAYLTLSGTSMATPNVSGSLFLLQEYYAQKNSGNFMLSSTLKGLVCHTALDAGNPGPDYIYGWGLLDMSKAAQAITDNGTKSIVSEKTITQGQVQTYNVTASGVGPLRATIAWTDPAGTATAAGTLNSRTPKLVNDLDIRVSDGTTTYKPWVLSPTNPSANATTGDNVVDNVEQVYIANAVPGVSYTITVSHKGTLSSGSQAYSLIVTGIGGSVYCASGPSSSADSRINNFTLSNINNTPAPGCTTYSDYTSLTATLEQGKTYPLSLTVGTCGANFNKIAKVFIDWNENGNFTDAGELVATSGVINGVGTFNTNITVPATVVPGNVSLMRIVLSETSDATTIAPCGTYAKGETQDYKVTFTQASVDAGITAINTPAASGTCPANNSNVSVKVKNFGTSTLTSIPVTVTITSAQGVVTTLNETYTGSLAPLADDDFNLTGTFAAAGGATYTITATTTLAADPIASNNQTTATAVINNSPVITASSASFCTDAKTYNLSATGSGQVFWYKNISDVVPFTFGSNVITAQTPVNNTFYSGLNDFSANVGPATKNVFTGGGYNQFTPSVTVTTKVPVLIKSARLYIGYPGKITFSASTLAGAVVSTTTINAAATRTTPGLGVQNDDPNDQGKVYNLNLALPSAGTYLISVSYADNATIYRNSATVTGYPFSIGNIFSISGNTVTSTTDTAAYKAYYYYFYDMHVQSLDCPGVARTAVAVVKPIITLNGSVLTSNFSQGNQWYLNGTLIAGATGQTYTPVRSGIYRVDVTVASGCISKANDFSFVLPAKDNSSDGAEIALALFPVPSNGKVNLAFTAVKDEQLSISVVNMLGQYAYKDTRNITAGPYNTILDLSGLASGAYFVRLGIGDKTYTRKISIVK
ncbi:putative secreted protein (Por secretion system target) [Mucilaginibacter gracilis]|uniref:Putative secreted protein (Por secretion system target) n=1 Tax=Mucilaginibacter gracilis TaxID=423350 RepID=A0A495IZZ6_9SPHI|nr:S8 family serine peptidase [Mucilaginibacter gracilis]RKR81688.1 putative secreted protein (Por secretion system target) [Mucilaginibacter gracilis]